MRRRALTAGFLLAGVVWALGACGTDPTEPEPEPQVVDDVSFVALVGRVYASRDPEEYAALLANDPASNAVFTFRITDAAGSTQSAWDVETEKSIHQRMFRPNAVPANDPPVDPELWLDGVQVTLTPLGEFVERIELYRSAENPGGVDALRWRATGARYKTDVFFQPSGNTEFVVDGEAAFVVLEDLNKELADAGKFLLLSWSDPCALPTIQQRECWSSVKQLYAK